MTDSLPPVPRDVPASSGPVSLDLHHHVRAEDRRGSARAEARRKPSRAESLVRELFLRAGITIDGDKPWDIRVHNPAFFPRLLREGSIGFGESYMDGWWDAESLDQCLERIVRANLKDQIRRNWRFWALALEARLCNLQSLARTQSIAEAHYGISNEFYEAMLDKRMVYTCGYWKSARTLDEAQEAKLDLICRKLGLQPGMKVLDLGCGWGGFSRHAAERYGAQVTGIANSREMVRLAAERCRGLPVEIKLQDFREVEGAYDRVVAIGLMEHVGPKNYRTLMRVVHKSLTDAGIFLLHTVGNNLSFAHAIPWVHKYIFPDAVAPSLAQIGRAMEGLFVIEDLHNIGPHYYKTLLAWWENFRRAWPHFRGQFDERFYRMWDLYLLGSAGICRARDGQVFQIVMTKTGREQPACRMS